MLRYYVIRVRTGEINVAAQNLKAQGFVSYCPMVSCPRLSAPVPMFAGYMFVKFDITKNKWRAISNTKGVISLLTATENRCSPLPKGFVEALRKRQRKGVIPPLVAERIIRGYTVGEQVQVTTGALAGAVGACLAYDKSKGMMLMALLGSEIHVKLPTDSLA